MATVDDVEVANASFPNVRQDLNDILEAITTNFSADTEPTTTYPNQFWYETDTNLLYIRNEADDAWITLASIDQTSGEWEPRTAVIQAIDSAGIALKTDDGTTRFSISDAGVVSFENYAFPSADGSANQVLTTDGSGTLTFEDSGAGDKIEEGNSSVEVVDTGSGRIEFTTDGSERMRIHDSGEVLIGGTTSIYASSGNLLLQKSNINPAIGLFRNDTSVSGNNGLGSIQFFGNDTTSNTPTNLASIQGVADGTHSAGDNPTRLVFSVTPDSSSTVTEQMRLASNGDLRFNSGFGSVATAYGCRAWVNFNGQGTVAIREDGNVSSITDNSTGNYTVNFATAMPDANYCVNATDDFFGVINHSTTFNTTSVGVVSRNISGTATDNQTISVAIFR